MAKKIIEARVIQKVGTAQEWAYDDFVLMDGEMGFERTSTGVPVNFKVGEGDKRYSELAYFHPYIINGSISTTQTIADLNALENGVYSAKGAGVYANGLESYEGQYTTFRKTDDGWHLDARVDVTWESQDLKLIEDQLDNHEQRITNNESGIQYLTDYTWGKAQVLANLSNRLDNLHDSGVKIGISYPELDNPTTQNSFNQRIFNYVKNGLASSSNFKSNVNNNVTAQFGFGTLEWRFLQTAGVPRIGYGLTYHQFGQTLRTATDEDNYTDNAVGYVGGRLGGVNWRIRKLTGQTQPSNINLPITDSNYRTAVISVNGQFADENGNINASSGGGETTRDIYSDVKIDGTNIDVGTLIPSGTNIEEFLEIFLLRTYYPTFVSPSYTLTHNAGNREVGEVITLTLTGNFNRGAINITNGSGTVTRQDFRAGAASSYVIDGTTVGGNIKTITNYSVPANKTFNSTVNFVAGAQPKDSKGNNYGSPYPAGSLMASATISGQYKRFFGADDSLILNARSLDSNFESSGKTFTAVMRAGVTQLHIFLRNEALVSVFDRSESGLNLTNDYVYQGVVQVKDAGGANVNYRHYKMTMGVGYDSAHNHEITVS